MNSELVRYKAVGRVVYSLHSNHSEVKVSKHHTESEAQQEAGRLNGTLKTVPMSQSQYYRSVGMMGLTNEEDDF